MAADAPPNSSAEIKEGRTRCEANSGGKEEADSLRVLFGKDKDVCFNQEIVCGMKYHSNYK